jgi:hypothetical protein
MRMHNKMLGIVMLGLTASISAAEDDVDAAETANPVVLGPCESQDGFHDFDFWLGEWEVHTSNGTLAGYNSIQSVEKGCLISENWTGASGSSGRSINYLDKTTDEWVQVWNAAGGTQINYRGGLTDDGMLLVGQIHYVTNGTTLPFRGLWTLLDDGRVRQFFEQSADGGETWTTWFEGFYTRIEDKKEE